MSKELKTGIVSIVIIALFVWGFNFLKGKNLFEPNSRNFFIEYDNIQGLNKTSIVTINGLEVGRVVGISFNEAPEKRGSLVVKISLDTDFEFSKNSIAKVYSTSLLGGQSLAIIPNYEGDLAKDGDYLKGEVESDIFSTVGEKLNPLQAKLENVIVSADSLLVNFNEVLNQKSRESLKNAIFGLESSVNAINTTIVNVNQLIDSSKVGVTKTLNNTKVITDNLAQLSDTLVNANLGATVAKLQTTLDHVNTLLSDIDNGKGTFGKLMKDEEMYTNLTNASKELEELLREFKLNPKRFVHFSLFGKKAKPYQPEVETPKN